MREKVLDLPKQGIITADDVPVMAGCEAAGYKGNIYEKS
jgi:hypothetical protein